MSTNDITISGDTYTIDDSSITTLSNVNSKYSWTYTVTDAITLPSSWPSHSGPLHVNGEATFDEDIKIKGKSILDSLEKIEEKLAVLHPNLELESRWEELRNLRNQYIELEKELLEKEQIWKTLKK